MGVQTFVKTSYWHTPLLSPTVPWGQFIVNKISKQELPSMEINKQLRLLKKANV